MSLFDIFSDISIDYQPLPAVTGSISARGVLWQVAGGIFLMEVPDVARYLVNNGREIIIDPVADSSPLEVDRYLKMLPLAAVAYQRGALAFHAAVAANDAGAVILTGDSGSGKSTLLMSLYQRGWRVLADDLALISLDRQGQPVVFQTAPEIVLWPGVLEKYKIEPDKVISADANRRKIFVSNLTGNEALPVCSIFRLGIHGKKDIELEKIEVKARFKTIGLSLYNSHVADALCDRVHYLRSTSAIAQSVPIHQVRRPRGVWSVDELADRIEQEHAAQ
jgi:hypothetical protein